MSRKTSEDKANRCKILWGARPIERANRVLTDKTWAHTHFHESLGLVTFTAKAGNRSLALESYSEELKTKISQSLLKKKYR